MHVELNRNKLTKSIKNPSNIFIMFCNHTQHSLRSKIRFLTNLSAAAYNYSEPEAPTLDDVQGGN